MAKYPEFRPLLAATIDDNDQLEKLPYPMVASPKVDGIRVICHPIHGPVTRSLKPLRNTFVRGALQRPEFVGFDGECVVGHLSQGDVFNRTTAVMAEGGHPDFTYWVFDDIGAQIFGYVSRLVFVEERMRTGNAPACVQKLPHRIVGNAEDVREAEQLWLSQGFEGIMLRRHDGRYKYGRSTLKEGILLKLKRFKDAEAIVIGFNQYESNQNPQTRDHLGYATRSAHKDGKRLLEALGSLQVRDLSGRFTEFAIGSGFDSSQRTDFWSRREELLGRTVTYKFQECGVVEAPRFPIFLRFRESE